MDTLAELLEDELKDIYNAEHQLLKALPRLAKKAKSEKLKAAFTQHTTETQGHIDRLEKIATSLSIKLKGKKCHAMEGLVEEGKEILEEEGQSAILDAALIGAAQRVEHYEMAAYGTVRAIAAKLGHADVAKLLQQTLEEEGLTDKKLTAIADGGVLTDALEAGDDEEEEEED